VRSPVKVKELVPESTLESFERTVVPLLDDAYTLARYLLRNEHDAQDVVQEAFLRAWRHYAGLRDGDARPWLLTIVRNCCWTWRRSARTKRETIEYDDEAHSSRTGEHRAADADAVAASNRDVLRAALAQLQPEYREALVLREIEGMSYKEMAQVAGVPLGTIMSRLARARRRLQTALRIGAREVS
jgi:RNA polymerase sigma-70 factor, ECF subfamily